MKTQQLRYFVCVADMGSVRAAAESLGVSAPAVSLALRELERTVGAPLLKREAQGATPTYAGLQLLTHARLILGQIARAEEELARIRGLKGGVLSIGVTPWIAQSILPPALTRFRGLRPDVRLDISETLGSAHPLLRDGTLDLVIALPPPRHLASNFLTRDLFTCDMAIIARRGHPLSSCTSLQDLTDQDWILTVRQDVLERPLSDMLKPYGIDPPPERLHLARSTLAAIALMQSGDMLTVCPWPLIESSLLRDRVQALPIRDALPQMTTSIIVRRNDTLGAAAQLFIDCFREEIQASLQSEDPQLRRIMSSVELHGQT
ncbi:HTH-type transcriptional regulator GbpR [Azoarcus sp. Aa7]|nr:HTH-type transcriptional regulator GbpR [Azoarcus sp. Aa7]